MLVPDAACLINFRCSWRTYLTGVGMYAQPRCSEWYCRYHNLLTKNLVLGTAYEVCLMHPMIDSRFLFSTLFALII